ncbi:LysE family translocator [Lonsdalea quercina]|uniref:LysE family translocator n=1 Tax=Lonsdalea quercina TaxID=71657 RepID=UPI0039769200
MLEFARRRYSGICVLLDARGGGNYRAGQGDPHAYDTMRLCGALYLLYLAWQTVRPGEHSPFERRELRPDTPSRQFFMGFVTNLLSP